jgi:chromosome segregation ATPase
MKKVKSTTDDNTDSIDSMGLNFKGLKVNIDNNTKAIDEIQKKLCPLHSTSRD